MHYFSLSKKCCGMPSFFRSVGNVIFRWRPFVITSQHLSARGGHVNHSLNMSLDLVSSLELRVLTPPNTYMQPDGVTVAE